jgi:hypothetical protein
VDPGDEGDVTWSVPRCPSRDTDILRLMTDQLGKGDSEYIAEAYYDYNGGSCDLLSKISTRLTTAATPRTRVS